MDVLDSRKERDAKRPLGKRASVTYLPGEVDFHVPVSEKLGKFGRMASIASSKRI